MTGPDATHDRRPNTPAAPVGTRDAAVFSDRVDILYRFGRHHLFLPFSALCIAGVLYHPDRSDLGGRAAVPAADRARPSTPANWRRPIAAAIGTTRP